MIHSIAYHDGDRKITVTLEDGSSKDYLDSATYLADFPDREADCYVFSYWQPEQVITVPQVITIRQAKLALLKAGILDDVDAAVANADRATQIEWEYATEVRRDWPTLAVVQGIMFLADEAVDKLFIKGFEL